MTTFVDYRSEERVLKDMEAGGCETPTPTQAASGNAVKPLVDAINDKELRTHAVQSLIGIGHPALEYLIEALKNADAGMRKKIAEILEAITRHKFWDDYQKWKDWFKGKNK